MKDINKFDRYGKEWEDIKPKHQKKKKLRNKQKLNDLDIQIILEDPYDENQSTT